MSDTAAELLKHEGLGNNLRFLLVEVGRQVTRVVDYLEAPTPIKARELLGRDDYIDQLHGAISRQCLALESSPTSTGSELKFLKALETVSANLERIADFCENIVTHVNNVPRGDVHVEADFGEYGQRVLGGIDLIRDALEQADVHIALEICKVERELDHLYEGHLRGLTRLLANGKHTKRRIAALLIAHYFERMGDSLENIGEAIISWLLGDRLKIQQIAALGDVLPDDRDATLEDIELHDVFETRSGCHISRVGDAAGDRLAIFKEGKLRKLAGERQSVEEWESALPGLVAKIYSFHVRGDTGAVLYEYLEGTTFQQMLVSGDDSEVEQAVRTVGHTLGEIWDRTRSSEPSCARFVAQLQSRLPEVYAVHPEFRAGHQSIAGRNHASFDELVERVAWLDDRLASFSVRIHGDLNVDNIIYRPGEGRVRLIDVHRSRAMDYVQDITVLLVSGQRLRGLDAPVRQRINGVSRWFFDFARRYAREQNDATFELRAALGLARSLATSTRFVLDRDLATNMYLRSRFLLQHVAAHGDAPPARYRLPEAALIG